MSIVKVYYNIKSNISNIYFNDGDVDEDFVKWIWNTNTNLFSLKVSMEPDIPEVPVTNVTALVYDLNDQHTLELELDIETSDDREDKYDYIDLNENRDFMKFIEDKLIPAFIKKFNDSCDIQFPMSEDDDFDGIEYRDDNFYAKLYSSSRKGSFDNISVKTAYFVLLNDFDPE